MGGWLFLEVWGASFVYDVRLSLFSQCRVYISNWQEIADSHSEFGGAVCAEVPDFICLLCLYGGAAVSGGIGTGLLWRVERNLCGTAAFHVPLVVFALFDGIYVVDSGIVDISLPPLERVCCAVRYHTGMFIW